MTHDSPPRETKAQHPAIRPLTNLCGRIEDEAQNLGSWLAYKATWRKCCAYCDASTEGYSGG